MPTLPIPNVWEIHPTLVHFPIALLLTAVAADLFGRRETVRRAAAGLLVSGVAFGWLTAAAGLLAYFTVPAHTEEAHTLMNWHLAAAATMLVLFTGVALVRWRRRAAPAGAGLLTAESIAALLLLFAGYLGGTIVYHGGAGVEPSILAAEVRQGHHHGEAAHGEAAHGEEPRRGHSH